MSSISRRGSGRGHPPPPAPHPQAAGSARGPKQVWVPRHPPAAAATTAAARGPHSAADAAAAAASIERPRGPVSPSPARLPPPAAVSARKPANPAPPQPPSSSSSSSSSSGRARGRGTRGRWRRKDEAAAAQAEAQPPQTQEEETRDWASLPLDAITAVLRKLDHVEILLGAGAVCRSWRHAARDEPALWRRIDMLGHPDVAGLYGMAREAIRRAGGQCEAFWAENAADEDVLRLLSQQAPALKSLRLIACQDIVEFKEEIKKFPMLEELEISLHKNICGKHVFQEIGKACPELKHFRFNKHRFYNHGHIQFPESEDDSDTLYNKDDDALGIASMHGLRSLQLFGNDFTNKGLTAILDNCPHLEFLDIRHCFCIQMDNALRAKCAAIKTLKLPHDSTDDYKLHFEGPIFSPSELGINYDTDSDDGGYDDYILDSDEYDDYCDPMRYLNGVYESELCLEDRLFLKGMRMIMRDDDDDDY